MRHSAILVYSIASVPHCGLFNRWSSIELGCKFNERMVVVLSPCPRCRAELFYRRLPWRSIESTSGNLRKTTCCPSCDLPLHTDPKSRRIGVLALLFLALNTAYGASLIDPLVGSGWGTIFRIMLCAVFGGVFVYSVLAFPYVAQELDLVEKSR